MACLRFSSIGVPRVHFASRHPAASWIEMQPLSRKMQKGFLVFGNQSIAIAGKTVAVNKKLFEITKCNDQVLVLSQATGGKFLHKVFQQRDPQCILTSYIFRARQMIAYPCFGTPFTWIPCSKPIVEQKSKRHPFAKLIVVNGEEAVTWNGVAWERKKSSAMSICSNGATIWASGLSHFLNFQTNESIPEIKIDIGKMCAGPNGVFYFEHKNSFWFDGTTRKKIPDIPSGFKVTDAAWLDGSVFCVAIGDVAFEFWEWNGLKWNQRPLMNKPRCAGGFCAMQDKLYFVGGLTRESVCAEVECFDSKANQWTQCTSLPEVCNRCQAHVWHGQLCVIGGFDEANRQRGDMLLFDGRAWSKHPKFEIPFYDDLRLSSCVVYN